MLPIFLIWNYKENIFLTVLRNLSYTDLQLERKCICSDQLLLVFTKQKHSKSTCTGIGRGFDKKMKWVKEV